MSHNFDEIIHRQGDGGKKWNTYPADVLPMWVADSDFRAPKAISRALEEKARYGVFGYTDDAGMTFEKAAARWMKVRFGWDADPSWVIFTPCLGAGLAFAVTAFTMPGDNVLVQTPIYPPFTVVNKNNGRNPLNNPLVVRDGAYRIDFEDLEKKLAHPRTTLMLLCNPHNPTGRAFTREELLRIGQLCRKHGVTVFSDEIHCDYVFDGHKHISFPTVSAELADISLVAINPSKTFNIADLRTAAVLSSNPLLRNRFAAAVANAKVGRCSFGITAFETAYTQCDDYADAVAAYIDKNLNHAVAFIKERIPRIKAYKPEATYLLWLDCRNLGLQQPELVAFFLEKAKVAMNSGADFGMEGTGFMRMNLACPLSTVKEGLVRIEKAVNAL